MVHKVLTVNADGLKNLQTPRGFAQRLEDGRWQLVCPYFSNKSLLPVALGASDESIWVSGNTDLFRIENGIPYPTEQPLFNGGSVRGLVEYQNQTYLLRSIPPTNSELLVLNEDGPPELLQEFEVPWKTMFIIDDTILLGMARADTLSLVGFNPTLSAITFEASWSATGIVELYQVNMMAGSLYASVRFMDRNSLLRLDEDAVELGSGVYQANLPLRLNDSVVTIIDSQVMLVEGDSVSPLYVNTEEIYEKFHETSLGILLSTSRGLYHFTNFETPPQELFLFSELHPPILEGLSERDLQFCETHWSDLKRDWQLPETPMSRPASTAPTTSEGPIPQADSHQHPEPPSQVPHSRQGCSSTNPLLLFLLLPLVLLVKAKTQANSQPRRKGTHRLP